MAKVSSKYKIHKNKPGQPNEWKEQNTINLELWYIRFDKLYMFFCRIVNAVRAGGALIPDYSDQPFLFLHGTIERDKDGKAKFKGKYLAALDIGIRKGGGHALVTVKIIDVLGFSGLSWYQSLGTGEDIEAVMTEEKRDDLYGELLYSSNGSEWYPEIPTTPCRFIQFKALERNATQTKKDKFSYNVWIPDIDGQTVHLEIDPDIQNPKV